MADALPDARPPRALDRVRLGRWEVVPLGVVWQSRVLRVGWTALPSPGPKGAGTPTVGALRTQAAAAWPADRAAPERLADRGFPRTRRFATLAEHRPDPDLPTPKGRG